MRRIRLIYAKLIRNTFSHAGNFMHAQIFEMQLARVHLHQRV